MQCKDIPELPILQFLFDQPIEYYGGRKWTNWFGDEYENSVTHAMPPNTPDKLVLAKMRQLIKKELVDGCDCGCRGDFVITDKGIEFLNSYKSAISCQDK